ncbi:MAG: hypothetical protein HYX84_01355 [Chloroflexi bacterium]|nr:hypothetical protein [Chloroflexota bacterium]
MVNAENKAKNPRVQPRVKNAVKGWIRGLHTKAPDMTALEIQRQAKREPTLKGMRIPSVRTIQQAIRDWDFPKTEEGKLAKERFEELEKPWHMGTLKKYPLAHGTIPYIFKVNEWGESQRPPEPKISIRQAFWLSQYYPVLAKEAKKLNEKDLQHLWTASHLYTYFELMSEFAGESEFDSSAIDNALWNGGMGYLLAEKITRFPDSAKKANAILNKKEGGK